VDEVGQVTRQETRVSATNPLLVQDSLANKNIVHLAVVTTADPPGTIIFVTAKVPAAAE
jgi:hypothetical protein